MEWSLKDSEMNAATKKSGRRKAARPATKTARYRTASRVAESSERREVVLYQAPGGKVQLEVQLDRDTAWLTQQQMRELFGRGALGHYQTRAQCVFRGRAGSDSSMCIFCTYCRGRKNLSGRTL
jgi:hypothetical protein